MHSRSNIPFHVENVSKHLSTFAACQATNSRFVYCVRSNRDRPNPKPTAVVVTEIEHSKKRTCYLVFSAENIGASTIIS